MIATIFHDLLHLLYPKICSGCGSALKTGEESIFSDCLFELPRTHYSKIPQNALAKIFWGRVELEAATSMCFFNKGQRIQQILHALKYEQNTQVGKKLGVLLGTELEQSPFFTSIDLIIPVPLHPRKEKIRGYNQSDFIAQGISKVLVKEMDNQILKRTIHSESQTKKGRFERWENVNQVFSVANTSKLKNKHILLVDDVITTGATLEAAASCLKKIEGVKVSVAAIASGDR